MTSSGVAPWVDELPSCAPVEDRGCGAVVAARYCQPVADVFVLVVGECLVDLAPAGEARQGIAGKSYVALPGGSPANVAVGLARLGVRTGFAGRFSAEGFGPWLRQHLSSNGVDLSTSVDATEPATLAVVTLDAAGRASYTFYGPETADWRWSAGELPVPSGFAAVHSGSLATTFEPGASVLAKWLEAVRDSGDAVVSFDPNVRAGLVADLTAYRDRLERLVACAHIVKASDDDLAVAYPGSAVEKVAESWLSGGAALVVVTEGPRGARAFHASGAQASCVPPAVEVADTIGAGDTFSASLLAYLASAGALTPEGVASLGSEELERAIGYAVAASAFTCTRPGADPPTATELATFCEAVVPRS